MKNTKNSGSKNPKKLGHTTEQCPAGILKVLDWRTWKSYQLVKYLSVIRPKRRREAAAGFKENTLF